jgi:3-hydroxybutyryl-CoA dehydrogenase
MSEGIRRVAVIGAGTMGAGIAQACAVAGLEVTLIDVAEAALERGLGAIRSSLSRLVDKGQLTAEARDAALALVRTTIDSEAFATVDLAIEAATENAEIKRRILQNADAKLPPTALLATNTSSISITELAACTQRADRFIGLHFFNPVPLMALVEVIAGLQSSAPTLEAARRFAQALGKTPVTVRNSPGFAVNRILCPMINEAIFTLQEGVASAEDIDAGMKLGCNHPIGPLALADLVGLDVLLAIMEVLQRDFGDTKYRPAPLLREMVAAGRLGRKTGHGFFQYR